MTLVGLEPGLQGAEDVGGLDAGGRGSGAVGVEVLVDVEDEVGGAAVGVLDGCEGGGGSAGDEGGGAGVAVSGEEDHLGGGSRAADGGYGCLDGGGPAVDVRHWKDS